MDNIVKVLLCKSITSVKIDLAVGISAMTYKWDSKFTHFDEHAE